MSAEKNTDYDLLIIGAGPGGYVAAIRAAQLGQKVACIEKEAALGGTCLNVGCIPSKALLESSHKYTECTTGLKDHGIIAGDVSFDLAAMMARKDEIVKTLTSGIDYLFKKNKIERFTGNARLIKDRKIRVTGEKEMELSAGAILIATGSKAADLPGVAFDETYVVSSTEALAFAAVPKQLVVVGAGAVGLELGSVWHRLGAEVTVVEYLDRILPTAHPEVASVGQTEDFLREEEVPLKIGIFNFKGNGRTLARGDSDGLVKVIAHDNTDRILGVHIIGPQAGDLLAEAVAAMEYSASSEDLVRTFHAHPTLSEVLKEAALNVEKAAIHG